MGWKAPRLADPQQDIDPYALEMLAQILDGHEAARLPTALVREQQIAVSVDASYDAMNRGPGMFILQASPRPGHTVAELEQAIRRALAVVAREGVTESELTRARSQLRAAEVYKKDSVMGQGMEIGDAVLLEPPVLGGLDLSEVGVGGQGFLDVHRRRPTGRQDAVAQGQEEKA